MPERVAALILDVNGIMQTTFDCPEFSWDWDSFLGP